MHSPLLLSAEEAVYLWDRHVVMAITSGERRRALAWFTASLEDEERGGPAVIDGEGNGAAGGGGEAAGRAVVLTR